MAWVFAAQYTSQKVGTSQNSLSFSGTGGLSGAEVLRLPRRQREFGSMFAWDFEAERSRSALQLKGHSVGYKRLAVFTRVKFLMGFRNPGVSIYYPLRSSLMASHLRG